MEFANKLNRSVRTTEILYHSSYEKIDSLEVGYGRFGVHVGSEEAAQNRADLKKVEVMVNQGRDVGDVAYVHEVEVNYQKALRLPEYIIDAEGKASGGMNWSATAVLNQIADLVEMKESGTLGFNAPIDIDFTDEELDSLLEQEFEIPEIGAFSEEFHGEDLFMLAEGRDEDATRVMSEFLKHYAGCDAIVYDNMHEGGGDSYIFFNEDQVKLTGVIKEFDTRDAVERINSAHEKAKAQDNRAVKLSY